MLTRVFIYSSVLLINSCIFLHKTDYSGEQRNIAEIRYRVMFWNVENLFDIYDDSLTNDDEFTPDAVRRWNYSRYKNKINNIYKVFIASGNPEPPEIIGLCEVENRKVLNDLVITSPFGMYEYKILHKDSEDDRGIDVAVLYNPKKIKVLGSDFVQPSFSSGAGKTRDILYMKSVSDVTDTVNLFVCHLPSKYGGAGVTEILRKEVAGTIRKLVDSIQEIDINARIIICGDMNDPPHSESISGVLKSKCYTRSDTIKNEDIYNLSCNLFPGTYKYNGIWENIDQFIVSGNLLKNEKKKDMSGVKAEIFSPEFLLEQDETFSGNKPFRTWEGMKYKGGFSDHLPVILNVY